MKTYRIRDEYGEFLADIEASSPAAALVKAAPDHPTAYEALPATFSWTVRVDVDERWVADGFDLTDERLQDILLHALPYANERELGGKVLKAPDVKDIRKAQGYGEEEESP